MASADYTVLTPERVSLEYGIAGIGSRGGAVMIDTALQVLALTVIVGAAVGGGVAILAVAGSSFAGSRSVVVGILALGVFIVTSGYFIVFEIVWNGQTPGKRLLGLRVLRESGYPIRPIDSVIRNLVRIVDWLPLFYGIGVLVMLANKRSKRLGDFAAGTLVVREGAQQPLAAPSVAESQGYALSSSDATLVRDFLVRRASLDTAARRDLARRLAVAITQRYQLQLHPAEDEDPEVFLERLG
jgi:uncharacterized RDD family membrane protein YckC